MSLGLGPRAKEEGVLKGCVDIWPDKFRVEGQSLGVQAAASDASWLRGTLGAAFALGVT